jgi:multiple sugar transport system ATP-binding protein
MATVTFDHVKKRYGSTVVVADFDFEIADHEVVVLVGGSGCGKSTTLRMLAGLESVTEGTIRIGDRDVTQLPPRERDVAMVFQDYALYPHLTARENIALGLRLRKIARPEIVRRVEWASELLGLGPLLDRKPKEMSGGQRQRVAMGRAMVREPAVFLFDEPLSNLDAKLRGQMRAEITRLQRRLGTTTLYVTHDQVEAMTIGHRLVVLDGGKVQQVGAPMEVYRAPKNRFVAGFIGSPPMNFFAGRIVGSPGAWVFEAEGVRVPLAADRSPRSEISGTPTLGIRPEDFFLRDEGGSSSTSGANAENAANGANGKRVDMGIVKGQLALAERLGPITHAHVELGKLQFVAALTTDRELVPDSPIELTVDPLRIHLFGEDGVSLLS